MANRHSPLYLCNHGKGSQDETLRKREIKRESGANPEQFPAAVSFCPQCGIALLRQKTSYRMYGERMFRHSLATGSIGIGKAPEQKRARRPALAFASCDFREEVTDEQTAKTATNRK